MSAEIPARYRALLNMVYPLADALQMKLLFQIRVKSDGQGEKEVCRLYGEQRLELPVVEGVWLDLMCRVQASNVSSREAWVLVKIRKRLWVLLFYAQDMRELYFWIINAEKVGLKESNAHEFNGAGLDKLVSVLGRGAVAIYWRKKEDALWKRHDNIGDMDEGPPGDSPGGSGEAT